MKEALTEKLQQAAQALIEQGKMAEAPIPLPQVTIPKERKFGDYATNLAMVLSKKVGMAPRDLAQALIDELGDGGFQECSGLEIEMDVDTFKEGGRNDQQVQRLGRVTSPNLVLKRGLVYPKDGQANRELWTWLQEVAGGVRPARRYDGTVEVEGLEDEIVARWSFQRALPAKLVGPKLDAKSGEIAIEELHLAHEGLRMEEVPGG